MEERVIARTSLSPYRST